MYVSIVRALISPAVKKLFTFVEPVISRAWLPELLTPQNTQKQPLELSAQRESKLSMTLQSFQNLASTCPCRLSSHRDPQGTPISCQSQLPPVFPFSETFLMLFPPPHFSSDAIPLISPDKCHLLWELITLPSEVPVLGGNLGEPFLLQCHRFLNVGPHASS